MQTKRVISVITVVFNNCKEIEETILSVVNQTYRNNIEYVIIDGNSTDGTKDIISRYEDKIDLYVSEPDRGIYDAMNKALKLCHGEWVIFMNAGDMFKDENVLSNIFKEPIPETCNFIYSDFDVRNNGGIQCFKASFEKGTLLHQAVIYRKKLHDMYGYYLLTPKYIVSDYLFFSYIKKEEAMYTPHTICLNGYPGVSAAEWCGFQKICVDYMFRKITLRQMVQTLIMRKVKNIIKKCLKRL